MTKNVIFIALVIALAVTAVSATTSQDLFTISIAPWPADKSTIRSGATVGIEVTMVNNSQRTVVIRESNPLDEYVINIRDGNGNPAPLTEYGRKFKSGGTKMIVNRNIVITLKPHERGTDVIPISDLYDMSHAGKYTIQIDRAFPDELGKGTARSNPLSILVTP